MDAAKKDVLELGSQLEIVFEQLSIHKKNDKLTILKNQALKPDFWNDSNAAQKTSKQIAKLERATEPWLALSKNVAELNEFIELDDKSLLPEIERKLKEAHVQFEHLKKQLRFAAEHDDDDAVITIQAGAGGTDAQDWSEMLMKMYLKWAERHDLKCTELSSAAGEEAGIKNVSFMVQGTHAYGLLKSENGVHRLVRQSPFNSAASRETSFAMVEVIPQLDDPDEVDLLDEDIKTDVYRAGGRGGQSVNTTDSAVRLTHVPTGVTVAIQNERSQIQNKATAMSVLRSKLAQLAEEQHAEKVAELKGPNVEAAWGNQIRSYVLHPYTMVKDGRTAHETTDVQDVLGGGEKLDEFIDAYLESTLGN